MPLSTITLILGLIHWFMYVVTERDMTPQLRTWLIPVLAFGVISMPLGLIMSHGPWKRLARPVTYFGYFWIGFFFITFSFTVVELFISFFRVHQYSYWPWLAASLASAWSIFWATRPPKLKHYVLDGPRVMKGLKLIQISDVHIGMPFLNGRWLERVVNRINALEPDFVAITGDLADGEFSEVAPQLEPLKNLRVKLQKFYVTGNHEFIRGGDWEKRLRELGFKVLHNEHEVFDRAGGRLMIGGVPDRVITGLGGTFESSPRKALASHEKIDYRILLAHEPRSVFALGDQKCDLLLSGHVHGGQIFPFMFFVRLAQPLARGFKKINGVNVFAHMGTGYWGPPMRWLTDSEIVEFTWTESST